LEYFAAKIVLEPVKSSIPEHKTSEGGVIFSSL